MKVVNLVNSDLQIKTDNQSFVVPSKSISENINLTHDIFNTSIALIGVFHDDVKFIFSESELRDLSHMIIKIPKNNISSGSDLIEVDEPSDDSVACNGKFFIFKKEDNKEAKSNDQLESLKKNLAKETNDRKSSLEREIKERKEADKSEQERAVKAESSLNDKIDLLRAEFDNKLKNYVTKEEYNKVLKNLN